MMKREIRSGGAEMAARFCSQCGHEISSSAKFCPHCGAPLTPNAFSPAAETTRMDVAARSTRRLLLPLCIAALIVLTVAVAVLAGKLRQQSLLSSNSYTPPAAPPLTNAPSSLPSAPPLTNAPTQPAPAAAPLTNAPTTGPGQLPPDVAAYLQFLKGIEDRRIPLEDEDNAEINASWQQAVSGENAKNAAQQLDENDSPPSVQSNTDNGSAPNQSLSNYENNWQTLIANFQSRTPPEQCRLLANSYYRFLSDDYSGVVQMHVDIPNVLSGKDKGAITNNWLTMNSKKDEEGNAADAALSDLCARYNAPKPFSIRPEGAMPSMLGQ
ncbi:MAG: zinc-ribbon domain-containing protein [Armatimonadetes bacterium]|nr:zinc-ribbon domain-containing protein [Armatimonadota bacterium]